jgi:hypothetical protein
MVIQKRRIQVTLDITCYDDLDVEKFDWKEIFQLEGDESINYINIKDIEYSY